MQPYAIFKSLCIIIVAAKLFGIAARKLKAPQVVGEIIAGLVIGPSVLGLVDQSDFLAQMAEIGVVLLMFSAGLQTNLQDLLKTGLKAFAIACAGVFIPLVGGTLLYMCIYGFSPLGSPEFYRAVFIGVIMTATSVSITVQTLKELGKLSSELGTTILSAAIIDDVIGIIVLTFVVGLNGGDVSPASVLLKTFLFFAASLVFGFICYKVFRWCDKRWPHTRRIPIAGLALCFGMAFVAERLFGIADITGAYVAGIILCNIKDSHYIERKMDVSSYMIFGPVFFASIGLQTSFDNFNLSMLWFSIALVGVALITKVIGCGGTARLCKFNNVESLKIGVGMMNRGEVGLIVAKEGLDAGLMAPQFFAPVIILIIVSSLATPIILKLIYSKWPDKQEAESAN